MPDRNSPVASLPGSLTFTTESDGLLDVFALSLNQNSNFPSVGLQYSKNKVTENNNQLSLFSDFNSDGAFGDTAFLPLLTNVSNFESLDPLGSKLARFVIAIANGFKEGKEITLTEL